MCATYITPDFYSNFSCKCGACRHTCCQGWTITLNSLEYYKLLGVSCSKELRYKLDGAFHVLKYPTAERYAEISPNIFGLCPLCREADGLCAIQRELGEAAIASVCRLYPRGAHDDLGVLNLSNSCEGVLETMFATDAPISLVQSEASIPFASNEKRDARKYAASRDLAVSVMQSREHKIPVRLMLLGRSLMEKDDASASNTAFARALAEEYEPELGEYATEALQNLATDSDFERARLIFELAFPKWEIYFEHMLVNHILFSCFPYSNGFLDVKDDFNALCAAYALTRFLTVGYTRNHASMSDFTDVCACAYRLIDHSNFNIISSKIRDRLRL